MRNDRTGVVIGGPDVCRHVIDVAMLGWTPPGARRSVGITAGNQVVVDAIGGGADRTRLVVGRERCSCDVVDESAARKRIALIVEVGGG